MQYLSESPTGKMIDHLWSYFVVEDKNMRLGIAGDEMNPQSL